MNTLNDIMDHIRHSSAKLEALGTNGVSTEGIQELLELIAQATDQVPLGDEKTWEELETLKARWGAKLQKLEAYLIC